MRECFSRGSLDISLWTTLGFINTLHHTVISFEFEGSFCAEYPIIVDAYVQVAICEQSCNWISLSRDIENKSACNALKFLISRSPKFPSFHLFPNNFDLRLLQFSNIKNQFEIFLVQIVIFWFLLKLWTISNLIVFVGTIRTNRKFTQCFGMKLLHAVYFPSLE